MSTEQLLRQQLLAMQQLVNNPDQMIEHWSEVERQKAMHKLRELEHIKDLDWLESQALTSSEVQTAMTDTIQAIKDVRTRANCTLMRAKLLVDTWRSKGYVLMHASTQLTSTVQLG